MIFNLDISSWIPIQQVCLNSCLALLQNWIWDKIAHVGLSMNVKGVLYVGNICTLHFWQARVWLNWLMDEQMPILLEDQLGQRPRKRQESFLYKQKGGPWILNLPKCVFGPKKRLFEQIILNVLRGEGGVTDLGIISKTKHFFWVLS